MDPATKVWYLRLFGSTAGGNISFEPGRGGTQSVEDMLEILQGQEIHYNYHTYHEPAFGLYQSWNELPKEDSLNQKLARAFVAVQVQ